MKKTCALTTAISMALQTVGPSWAAADQILDQSLCQKKLRGEVVSALCGRKVDPTHPELGYVKFRTYTDPSSKLVVNEYLIGKGSDGKPIVHVMKLDFQETKSTERKVKETKKTVVVEDQKVPLKKPAPVPEKVKSSTGHDWLIIGGAVLAVGGLGLWARHHYKSKYEAKEQSRLNEERAYREGVNAGKLQAQASNPVLRNLPNRVVLGPEVPGGLAGQSVSPVGAVHPNSVPANTPIYQTQGGDRVILQQNPNTGLLETLLVYDLLTRPFFWGPFHYHSLGYSPWIYSPSGHVTINETVVHSSKDVSLSQADHTAARESVLREEVTTTTTESSGRLVSDNFETQTDFLAREEGRSESSPAGLAADVTDSGNFRLVEEQVLRDNSAQGDSYFSNSSDSLSSIPESTRSVLDQSPSFSDQAGSSSSAFESSRSSDSYSSGSSSYSSGSDSFSSGGFDSGGSSFDSGSSSSF